MIHHGVPFPKTHNLATPVDLLPQSAVLPDEIDGIIGLTHYAVLGRYPADLEPIDAEEYRRAVELAETAVSWAAAIVEQ